MRSSGLGALVATWLLITAPVLHAQAAQRVEDDLKFTQEISARFHITVQVSLLGHDGTTDSFQYDRYPADGIHPNSEWIKREEGIFSRTEDGDWVRSDNDQATAPISAYLKSVLQSDIDVVEVPFKPSVHSDATQGGLRWRYLGTTTEGALREVTFEETREHPKANVIYPRYSFLKAPGDRDGRLFLCRFKGNLRDDSGLTPVAMSLHYLLPVAAGTKVVVYDKDSGKEKLNIVTGPNSGWEITSMQSEPPPRN